MAAAVLNSFYSLYLSNQSSTAGNTITVTNKPLPKPAGDQVQCVRQYTCIIIASSLLFDFFLSNSTILS